jgi:hypothetical protein
LIDEVGAPAGAEQIEGFLHSLYKFPRPSGHEDVEIRAAVLTAEPNSGCASDLRDTRENELIGRLGEASHLRANLVLPCRWQAVCTIVQLWDKKCGLLSGDFGDEL